MTSLSMWSVAGDWCLISPFGCLPAHILCWQHCPGLEKVILLHSSLSSEAQHRVAPVHSVDTIKDGPVRYRAFFWAFAFFSHMDFPGWCFKLHLLQYFRPTCATVALIWLEGASISQMGTNGLNAEEKLHRRFHVQLLSRSSNIEWSVAVSTGETVIAQWPR